MSDKPAKVLTLEELDVFIQGLKKGQEKIDTACNNGREYCSYCRYVGGYWGDVKVAVRMVDE